MLAHPRTADEPDGAGPKGQTPYTQFVTRVYYVCPELVGSFNREITDQSNMTATNADVRIDQIVDALRETEGDHDESTVSFFADGGVYEFNSDNPRVLHDIAGTVVTEYELTRVMDNPFEDTD